MVKGTRLWGVIALCILSGSGWILTQGWPSEMAWPFAACIHFGMIGLTGLVASILRGESARLSWIRCASMSVAGACLFALPAVVTHLAAGKVPEFTSVAAFCALPLMTVMAAGALGAGDGGADGGASRLRGLIAPGVAGLGGALLLSPLENPGSLRRWLFLGLVLGCCILVALTSVWMHRLRQKMGVAAAVAINGLVNAALLGSYGTVLGRPVLGYGAIAGEMLRCGVLDLPVVWLTVWLLKQVSAERLSARFLLVPFVTAVEGYALERGPFELKTLLALCLFSVSGMMLLLQDEPEEPPGLGLR